jgi:ribosomal protein S25
MIHIHRKAGTARMTVSEIFRKRYEAMLEYQREIHPFTPTVRELMEKWGMRHVSVAYYTLRKLEKSGKVVSRKHGKTKSYYARD